MKSLMLLLLFSALLPGCQETTEPVKIPSNYALSFNGFNGYLELPRPAFVNLPVGTVEIRVKASSYDAEILYRETYSESTISGIRITADGHIKCSHENFNSVMDVISHSVLKQFQWYHVAWTWDGQFSKIYINGTLDASIACSDVASNVYGEWLRLGRGDSWFLGKLDDLRIWNIAKTAEQLKVGMNTKPNGTENNLIGNWDFNEASGDTAFDNSFNAYHATLNGGVTWVVY